MVVDGKRVSRKARKGIFLIVILERSGVMGMSVKGRRRARITEFVSERINHVQHFSHASGVAIEGFDIGAGCAELFEIDGLAQRAAVQFFCGQHG